MLGTYAMGHNIVYTLDSSHARWHNVELFFILDMADKRSAHLTFHKADHNITEVHIYII